MNSSRAERSPDVAVRAFVERDFDDLVTRWHETNLVSYRYNEVQQKHTLSDARDFFRNQLLPTCEVMVATRAGQLLGMLALQEPWIRQLAVFPEHQRKGSALSCCATHANMQRQTCASTRSSATPRRARSTKGTASRRSRSA